MSEVTARTSSRNGALNDARSTYLATSTEANNRNAATAGARIGLDTNSGRENPASQSSRNNSLRQKALGSTRVPLTSIPANRNRTTDDAENYQQSNDPKWSERQGADNVSINSRESDIPDNMYRPDKEDREGWIHREKLAKIENEELQAAGINLAKARSSSKLPVETPRSTEESISGHSVGQPEENTVRVASPILEEDDGRETWDLRSPEEIAEESVSPPQAFVHPVIRKSGSKIPILSSSPSSAVPEHPEHTEYPSFIPRKRTISNSTAAESQVHNLRIRPSSRGADAAFNLAAASTPSPTARIASTTSSPTKSKAIKPTTLHNAATSTPGARKTTPAGRKSSLPQKGTQNSTTSPSQRPTTSSGDRPRTAINRPEGDPPWLATMYKPDPMLHPDLQIIPTHARKQQQQQWAMTDAVPSVYDKDFTPLAVHIGNGVMKQPTPQPSPGLEKTEGESNTWPLQPLKSPTITIPRPTSSYSVIPRVSSPKISSQPGTPTMGAFPRDALHVPQQERGQSRSPTRSQFSPQSQQQQGQIKVTRMPVPEKEEGKKDKSCGCCVVM